MSNQSELNFTVVIPSRFGSSRLPGKPLELINGKPMVEYVYRQALQSNASRVVVATDDQRIADAVSAFGGEYCMTAVKHESGTDRIQEVAKKLGLSDEHIVVNVQGDEPLIPPAVINQVALNLYKNSLASAATLSETIGSLNEFVNPNAVKLVTDKDGYALYFSRASIPWPRDDFSEEQEHLPQDNTFSRHIGIYAYKVSLLNEFVTWPMSPLEKLECLEQLRILWNGHRLHVEQAIEMVPGGVDTPEDLERIRAVFEES
jgi:3-deoxy-manno-octulosonate cytidylyltransferase (CMP-KDO synthetase)